jgi:hypothetical protein
VSWRTPDGYHEDVAALNRALIAARDHASAPSIIALSTIIGWPAPRKQNTGAAHGSALGADEVAATKQVLGFEPAVSFPAEDEAVSHARAVADRAKQARADWEERFAAWARRNPGGRALFGRLTARGAGRLGRRDPHVRVRFTGHGDANDVGQDPERARARAPRALGRVSGPGGQQRHDHGRRALLHPRRASDRHVRGQPVRPHPALRHQGVGIRTSATGSRSTD